MRRLLGAALAAALIPATAQAASKPDLTISKASSAGGKVTYTVKNSGGPAGKSTTGLLLSKDAKSDKADRSLGTFAQKAIKAKKTATGSFKVSVPGGLAAGRYTLLVCADSANKVKESKETNNCREAGVVDVGGAGTTPAPAPAPVPAPAAQAPAPLGATPAPTAAPTQTQTATATPTPEPFTTKLTEAPQDISPLQSARFAFSATETADGFECRLDTAAFAPCVSPLIVSSILAGDHAFEVRAKRGGTYAVTARKAWSIQFEAPAPGPTDAAAAAPETQATVAKDGEITLVGDTTRFLYQGANAIQKNVAPNAIADNRAAVLRGKVIRRNGSPIDGVRVTVADHPELGRTATRTDGGFELAVNGGGSVTLQFEREGYVPSQRQLEVPTQEYEGVEQIVMVPYEDKVTGVDLTTNQVQIAQGATITDGDGTRRATLLLDPGTEATATLPDGTEKDLGDKLNIRATEFTIGANGPAAMPGELPPTSAYTYAVEYSVDEANKDQAVDVAFDKPIVTYVDNLTGFPAGTAVPMGYYDREQNQWIAAKDGIVIKILSEANGRAALDVTGDGVADTGAKLTALGIDDAELAKLAELYDPGKSLWRAAITHFTPWDYNWPYGLPDGAGGPGQGGPDGGDPPGDNPCGSGGSIILCENQVLGEQSPISGTPYSLVYQSDRLPGRRTGDSLEIPLTNAAPPAAMTRVDLTIEVAGRTITQSYNRAPNLSYTFIFDGKDAYGRPVQGQQKIDVTIDYVYPAVYRAPSTFGSSFAAIGGAVLSANRTRQEISVGQQWSGVIGGLNAPASALAGWSLDVHHTYDPIGRTLYMGDGSKRSADGQNFDVISTMKTGLAAPEGMASTAAGDLLVADSSAHVVRRIAPDGTTTTIAGTGDAGFAGDGGPATAAKLDHPSDVAVGPDGAIYIADEGNNRVRKILAGKISTLAGTGEDDYSGDGGQATAATLDEPSDVSVDAGGAVYIVDRANDAVRRVGPDGIIATLAGNGSPGVGQDGVVATKAKLHSPRDVSVRETDGSVFIADGGNHRVRRIDPDGTITTVAGNGVDGYRGDGGLATQASLDTPSAVLPLRDGGFLIADAGNATLRKVSSDGTISTVAGNGTPGSRGDGGPAAQARIDFPQAIVLGADETIYVADEGNDRVRALAPSLPGLSLGEFTIASDDGRSLYVFDRSGRHLRTLDALTKAAVLTFGYDSRGRLTAITDGDGNQTRIERDTTTGAPKSIVAPFGQTTTLGLDAAGYLSSITNAAGDRIGATYDAGGLLKTLTDPRNGVHSFDYDPLGRLIKDTAADGSFQTLTRTVSGNAVSVALKSGEGRTTTYRVERTAEGSIKRTVTDGEASATVTETGNDGITTVTRPDGTKVSAEIGPDPRFGMQSPVTTRMTITTPGGRRSALERSRSVDLASDDPLSLRALTETTTLNGKTSTMRFDAATRRFTDASPTGRTLTTEVDAQSRPTRVEVPGVTPTVFTYDAKGRVMRSAQGTRAVTYGYDARGRIGSVTDPLSRATEFTYDDADRPTSQKLPDGRVVGYSYDRNGNLMSVTPPGRTAHTFTYSPRNAPATYTPPLVGTAAPWTYTPDKDNLITGVQRPDGTAVGYTYDDAARLEQLTQPRGTTRFTYSGAQMQSATAPGGEKVEYGYDGLLQTRTTVSGSVAGEVTDAYDDDLRLVSETVGGAAAVYDYDDDGMLTKAGALTLTRDADDGLIGSLGVGGNTTAIARNAFGEPESFTSKHGATTVYGETYTRDNSGRITAKTETRGTATTSYAYTYDTADRLATVTRNGGAPTVYTYDANGNRGTTRAGETITYDGRDRIATVGGRAYTYSSAGDLASKTDAAGTTTYTYDALGALTKATLPGGSVLDYAVDAAGRRVSVKKDGVVVRGFLYRGEGLGPVAELNADGSVKSRFIYATHGNVPDLMIQSGKTYRIISDQVGSPRAVVDTSTGAVLQELDYDEFGNVTREVNPDVQPFRFGGGLGDRDTGLVRFGARDYDPGTGRFTTPDPLRFGGGGTNLYGYALNDPVNLADPSGQILDTLLDIGFIAYDLFDIGRSLMNGCGVSGTQALALGADIAGALIPFATGGGAAVRAASHERQIGEGIYEVMTKEGLPYVGQSGNIDRRLGEHVASGKITQEAADAAMRTEVQGGKTAREIAEQRRINEITDGVGASSPDIANKVNPIGPKRQHLLD